MGDVSLVLLERVINHSPEVSGFGLLQVILFTFAPGGLNIDLRNQVLVNSLLLIDCGAIYMPS